MDDSTKYSRSLSETSPLLIESSTSVIYKLETPIFPKTSLFSCAVVCILLTQLCERLTYYGIYVNIVLFATEDDHLDMTPMQASTLALVFQGTCSTMPVLGGWIADSKAGKFSAIFFSAIIYLTGTTLLPIGSITDKNDEYSKWAADHVTTNTAFKKAFYITGLFLVALGTGGIRANLSPFGADQVSNRGPEKIQEFFSWLYWFINFGALLAFTVVVYIQQNISFFYGNLIPAGSLVLALIFFRVGKPAYCIEPPTGSVFSAILKIVKDAIKKFHHPTLSSSSVNHWLDRAKMCFGGSYSNLEVEDVKHVYRLLPIFATFILCSTVYSQMSTSMIYQGKYMDIKLGNFNIPIASLSLIGILGILILIPFMEKLVYPLLAKFGIRPSQLQRIGVGMVISTASMVCAGGIEWYRVEQCCSLQDRWDTHLTNVSRITIFYQIPQYTLQGLSEVLVSVTGLELAYSEAPKSLQGVIMGLYLLSTGLGAYFGAILFWVVDAVTKAKGGPGEKWYPDKDQINNGHWFAYYFFCLAVLMLLNFILYIFVAFNFKAKKEATNCLNLSSETSKVGTLPDRASKTDEDPSANSKS